MLSAGKAHHANHLLFYYYGREHLLVNLYHYIRSTVEDNGMVFICTDRPLFEELLAILRSQVDHSHLRFINPQRVHRLLNLPSEQLEKVLFRLAGKYEDRSGIHLIQQIDVLLRIMSEEHLIAAERYIDQVLVSLDQDFFRLFCAYNFKHYLQNTLPREVLKGVNEINEYRFFKFNSCWHRGLIERTRNGIC